MSDLFLSVCKSVQNRYSYGLSKRLALDLVQQLVAAAFGYSSLDAFKSYGGNDLSVLAALGNDLSYFFARPHSKFRQFCIDEDRLEKRCAELQTVCAPNPSMLSACLVSSLYDVEVINRSCEISEDETELTQRLAVLANSALLDDANLIAGYREITISPLSRVIRGNLISDIRPCFSLTFEVNWCEKAAISWIGPLAGDFVRDECTITMHRPKPRIFLLEKITFPKFKARARNALV